MRLGALVLLAATTAGAKPRLPFDLPRGWLLASDQKVLEDQVYRLQHAVLGAEVIWSTAKVADSELESAATERHAARVKNRVAWGMKAQAGPPREPLRLGGRRAVRWRDRIGGALGSSEQIMTCVIAGGRLACVVTFGPEGARDEAEEAAGHILQSLKR